MCWHSSAKKDHWLGSLNQMVVNKSGSDKKAKKLSRNLLVWLSYLPDLVYAVTCGALTVTIIATFWKMLAFGNFYKTVRENVMCFLDFVEYYVFSSISASPDACLIYHPDVQRHWMSSLTGSSYVQRSFFAEYVPYTGILLHPLVFLPIDMACMAWLLFETILAFIAVVWVARKYGNLSRLSALAVAVAGFASIPGFRASFFGQLSWLMVPLAAVFVWALLEKHDFVGGISLSIMSLKPHYALAFLLSALAWKRWRLLGAFCLLELVLTVAAGQVIGWNNVFSYPSLLFQLQSKLSYMGSDYRADSLWNIGVLRLLATFLPESQRMLPTLLTWFLGLALIYLIWCRARPKGRLAFGWAVAISILVFLTTSPHSHDHDAVLIALAAAVTLKSASLRKMFREGTLELKLWTSLFLLYPALTWYFCLVWNDNSAVRNLSFLAMHLVLLVIGMKEFIRICRSSEVTNLS